MKVPQKNKKGKKSVVVGVFGVFENKNKVFTTGLISVNVKNLIY